MGGGISACACRPGPDGDGLPVLSNHRGRVFNAYFGIARRFDRGGAAVVLTDCFGTERRLWEPGGAIADLEHARGGGGRAVDGICHYAEDGATDGIFPPGTRVMRGGISAGLGFAKTIFSGVIHIDCRVVGAGLCIWW